MSNATSVHVRRPGNAKKWKATVLCEAKSSDLALLTVEEELFWQDEMKEVKFVDVPDLQVRSLRTLSTMVSVSNPFSLLDIPLVAIP